MPGSLLMGRFSFQRLLLLSALTESFCWLSFGWELLQPLPPADSCVGEAMHCSKGAQLQPGTSTEVQLVAALGRVVVEWPRNSA